MWSRHSLAMASILQTAIAKDFAQRPVANAQTSNRRSLPWPYQGEVFALVSNPGADRLTSLVVSEQSGGSTPN